MIHTLSPHVREISPGKAINLHSIYPRFLEALSEVDSSQFSETSTKYTETLITEKGKRIAAPDLRQKKQLALVAALLKCRYSSEWFRVKDLMPCLSGKL